jgi:hypothetical protein
VEEGAVVDERVGHVLLRELLLWPQLGASDVMRGGSGKIVGRAFAPCTPDFIVYDTGAPSDSWARPTVSRSHVEKLWQ